MESIEWHINPGKWELVAWLEKGMRDNCWIFSKKVQDYINATTSSFEGMPSELISIARRDLDEWRILWPVLDALGYPRNYQAREFISELSKNKILKMFPDSSMTKLDIERIADDSLLDLLYLDYQKYLNSP